MPAGSLIKKEILKTISDNNDESWYITKLAKELPVSKTAVSKHVKDLEEEGKVESFKIEGSNAKYVKIKEDETRKG